MNINDTFVPAKLKKINQILALKLIYSDLDRFPNLVVSSK